METATRLEDSVSFVLPAQRVLWMPSLQLVSLRPFLQLPFSLRVFLLQLFWPVRLWLLQLFELERPFWRLLS